MNVDVEKQRKRVREAALDLADAVLDLAEAGADVSPKDRERLQVARVYLHELVGGDRPPSVPYLEVLFTIGVVFEELRRMPMSIELYGLVAQLSGALEALATPTGPDATGSCVLPSSRPPGVPRSVPDPPVPTGHGRWRRFYRKRRPLSDYA